MSVAANDTNGVIVSVAMITYNHERYIAQAIEGVLMQQTSFTYELVIGEDCSTDGTRRIVEDYALRFPDRVRPLLRDHNLGMLVNSVQTKLACRGAYIALCEGDDYWTDPRKLQKQVDFLVSHPGHVICFHPVEQFVQATGETGPRHESRRLNRPIYSLGDLARANFIPTQSVMYRNGIVTHYPAWYYEAPCGDWPLFVLLAEYGTIGFVDEVMAVYRVHSGGVFGGAARVAQLEMWINTLELLRTYLGPRYRRQIQAGISDCLLGWAVEYADRGEIVRAKEHLLRSIAGCPLNRDMRIIDKLALLIRLYARPVYRFAKRLQASLSPSL